jgi:four helix bundle protein
MAQKIVSHRDLQVYRRSFDVATQVFEASKRFPREEMYSLTDQVRRSSRSVSANIAEAWRKRRYEAAFISKLSDAETEAAETQVWIEFALACGYLTPQTANALMQSYDAVIGTILGMINHPETWVLNYGRK